MNFAKKNCMATLTCNLGQSKEDVWKKKTTTNWKELLNPKLAKKGRKKAKNVGRNCTKCNSKLLLFQYILCPLLSFLWLLFCCCFWCYEVPCILSYAFLYFGSRSKRVSVLNRELPRISPFIALTQNSIQLRKECNRKFN